MLKFLIPLLFIFGHLYSNAISVDKYGFKVDGKYRLLRGGTLQWFRLPESEWEDRLRIIKAAGFNTIDLYVPWSIIEPEEGKFTLKNLLKFLHLVKKHKLFAYFRPGPYITNEMDMGGLPAWLIKLSTKDSIENDGMVHLRNNDPDYLYFVDRYFGFINKAILPYLFTNGGPIILYALENEYDYFEDFVKVEKLFRINGDIERSLFYKPNTAAYFKALRNIVLNDGIDVPLTTCPGRNIRGTGNVPGIIPLPNLYIKKRIEWNVWNDLNLMHDPSNFDGAYTSFPSGITEADRYPALMKRVLISGMDAFFAFNIVGASQRGFKNAISMYDMDLKKLLTFNNSNFIKVGYFHNVYDYHGMVGASGGIREKFHGFRRANLFFDAFESDIASSYRSNREGSVKIFDKRVGADENGKKFHYHIKKDGTYYISLLNETTNTLILDKESIEVEGIKFPKFSKLTLGTEIDDMCNHYKDDESELFNSQILVFNKKLTNSLILKYTTSEILTKKFFNGKDLLVIFGKDGSRGEISLEGKNISVSGDNKGLMINERGKNFVTLTYDHTFQVIDLEVEGKFLRVLVLNRYLAGRTWFYNNVILVGPDYFSDGLMEFSEFYKNREVYTLSDKPVSLDKFFVLKQFDHNGVTKFIHKRDFNFQNFSGKINQGFSAEEIDGIKGVLKEKIKLEGYPKPLEELGITEGHAWYVTEFDLKSLDIQSAGLFVEHASDFIGIYINGKYVTTVAPLGTEISSFHQNSRYNFGDLKEFLRLGKNIIVFKVEIWGHGSFMFPRGKLLGRFAQIPALGFDSRKGLYGKAYITLRKKRGKEMKPLNKWKVSKGFNIDADYGKNLRKIPTKLKKGEIFWYSTSFSKNEFPDTTKFRTPLVLNIEGRSVKGTIYLNGDVIGRYLSDNDFLSQGTWVDARRDMWASASPDHYPIYSSNLRELNTLSILFEDTSARGDVAGEIYDLSIKHGVDRWASKDKHEYPHHMMRSIKISSSIRF